VPQPTILPRAPRKGKNFRKTETYKLIKTELSKEEKKEITKKRVNEKRYTIKKRE
jgi:hypothetical protein